MAVDNFLPEIWSSGLLATLERSLVFGSSMVVNRDYEGEITGQGDTVRITTVGDPTIATYTKGSTTINPEQLTTAQQSLLIDQSKYFAFEVDDVDKAQAANAGGLMDQATQRAGFGLRNTADLLIAGFYTQVATANQIGTVAVTTAALAYTQIRKLKVALDEADVPDDGTRWCVVPPWYHGLLLEDDRFVKVGDSGTSEGLRNGRVGRALGFNILMSNNVVNTTGDDWAVMAGYPGAITYAEQIVKTEAYRPEDSFSDAIKGLHVYGSKVVRPSAIASVVASET